MRPSDHSLTLAILVLCFPSSPLWAAGTPEGLGPTVAALIEVCDRAAAQGNRGVDAAMCEWYAAPCACKLRGIGANPWCVPEQEGIDQRVRKVLAELRAVAEPTAQAEPAVQEVLAQLYPCPDPP